MGGKGEGGVGGKGREGWEGKEREGWEGKERVEGNSMISYNVPFHRTNKCYVLVHTKGLRVALQVSHHTGNDLNLCGYNTHKHTRL